MFRKIISFTAVLLAAAVIAATAIAEDKCAQPSPEKMAAAFGVELPPRPWHVANIWWDFQDEVENFESLEIDVSIDRDVPETYNLYIAPCGLAEINDMPFYGGIQTNINGWPSGDNRVRVHSGKGAIFSRWSSDLKTPIGLDHVRVADPSCLVESAGYEGEFASVRRPLKWKKGTYTWSITKGETVEHKGGRATWFTCWVKDLAGGDRVEVGSLRFEGEDFTFWARHSAFVEVYSTSEIPRSKIPKVNVTFGWPRINGKKVAIKEASAYYPKAGTGSGGSPACANIVADGDNCVVQVGPIFKRDEAQRRHQLKIK